MRAFGQVKGFTLVEVAIVLLVLGILSRSFLQPIASAQVHQKYLKTESKLESIKESLLAHVIATGALPCPVSLKRVKEQVVEKRKNIICKVGQGGLPAKALAISGPTNQNGALLDIWNRPYLYAVSLANHASEGNTTLPDWTSSGEASSVGISNLSSNLTLCTDANAVECPMRRIRANELAFVVLSHGRLMTDSRLESENIDNDTTFVLAEQSSQEANFYDDQLVWASAQELIYWMLRAAWLP